MAQKLGYTEELRAKLHSKSTKKKRSYTARVMLISDEFNANQRPTSIKRSLAVTVASWPLDGGSERIQEPAPDVFNYLPPLKIL